MSQCLHGGSPLPPRHPPRSSIPHYSILLAYEKIAPSPAAGYLCFFFGSKNLHFIPGPGGIKPPVFLLSSFITHPRSPSSVFRPPSPSRGGIELDLNYIKRAFPPGFHANRQLSIGNRLCHLFFLSGNRAVPRLKEDREGRTTIFLSLGTFVTGQLLSFQVLLPRLYSLSRCGRGKLTSMIPG